MTHPEGSHGGFPHRGKSFREQIIQRLPVVESGSETRRLILELRIAHGLDLGFQFVDAGNKRLQFFQLPFVLAAEYLG